MLRKIFFALVTLSLAACAGSSSLVTGKVSKAVEPEEVRLYLADNPDCDFEVIALIQIPGEYRSQQRLVEAFRTRAAQFGANAVHVHFLHMSTANYYRGQGRALRCLIAELPAP